jgi:chromatin segregation and condensation protein Rec8/ScpA/Scc1 (kleisin family)
MIGTVGEETPAGEETIAAAFPEATDGRAEVHSFFTLIKAPPGDADSAARRFLNLLSLHMDGHVTLEQSEPYGDISIHQGDAWQGGLVVEDHGAGGA